jgi:hypothetical protein
LNKLNRGKIEVNEYERIKERRGTAGSLDWFDMLLGDHVESGITKEEEFVKLGNNICASMCYFAIKKYNA